MTAMASQLHQPHEYSLNRLFRRRSKKTSQFRDTGLCVGNSPVTSEFPTQRTSYAENVSIWWRHHDLYHHGPGMVYLLTWRQIYLHSLKGHRDDRDGVSTSPASRLFTQSFIQAQIKENIKDPSHWPLCGEFTGDRWIPHTKDQLRGKCFHLMTSSCNA